MESLRQRFNQPSTQAAMPMGRMQSAKQNPQTQTQFQSKVSAEHWLNLNGKDYRLVGKTIRIGRAPDNDIIIDHKSVSRYHAMLTIQQDQIVLEDLKSRNGIYVNGNQAKRMELKDNDEIRIGDLEGLFFQRKKPSQGTQSKRVQFGKAKKLNLSDLVVKFKALDARRQKLLISAAALVLIAGWMFFSSGDQHLQKTAVALPPPVVADLNNTQKMAYESCIESEDLGNFRQASTCLKGLPQTSEVQVALNRVIKRQEELSERRFKEGQQAFENYYFDIAILKWQEVMLISDDGSQFRTQAFSGIQQATEKKRPR